MENPPFDDATPPDDVDLSADAGHQEEPDAPGITDRWIVLDLDGAAPEAEGDSATPPTTPPATSRSIRACAGRCNRLDDDRAGSSPSAGAGSTPGAWLRAARTRDCRTARVGWYTWGRRMRESAHAVHL